MYQNTPRHSEYAWYIGVNRKGTEFINNKETYKHSPLHIRSDFCL